MLAVRSGCTTSQWCLKATNWSQLGERGRMREGGWGVGGVQSPEWFVFIYEWESCGERDLIGRFHPPHTEVQTTLLLFIKPWSFIVWNVNMFWGCFFLFVFLFASQTHCTNLCTNLCISDTNLVSEMRVVSLILYPIFCILKNVFKFLTLVTFYCAFFL